MGQLGHGKQPTNTSFVNKPTLIEYFKQESVKIAYIAGGGCHSGAICTNGNLFTFGENRWGQLGTGNTENKTVPTKIHFDVPMSKISCGGTHTIALPLDGTHGIYWYPIIIYTYIFLTSYVAGDVVIMGSSESDVLG